MTKREFFENELKMMPSEIGSAVPMNVDGEKEVTEAWLMAFVKHLVEDLKEAKKWHTGTPTEEGFYLLTFRNEGYADYCVGYWDREKFCVRDVWKGEDVEPVAWQKIAPYEENK